MLRNRMAERVGFEPTERFPVHSISSAASSTTPAPLRKSSLINCGGEGGIRTHGGRKPPPVFWNGALTRDATAPRPEKHPHQRPTLRFQHARADLNPVIQKI